MQMLEAFRALNALNEDVFSMDADGVEKLSTFMSDDLEDDTIDIIDPEAETEADLQDNYIGKVILDCCVCHSKLYKNKEEVVLSDTEDLANVGEECPYCFTPDGFKVVGEVAAFNAEAEEEEEDPAVEDPEVEASEEEEPEDSAKVEESLQEGIFDKFKKKNVNVLLGIYMILHYKTWRIWFTRLNLVLCLLIKIRYELNSNWLQ